MYHRCYGNKIEVDYKFSVEICSKIMEEENIHSTEKNNTRPTIYTSEKSTIYT